jgi:hypothetical protein
MVFSWWTLRRCDPTLFSTIDTERILRQSKRAATCARCDRTRDVRQIFGSLSAVFSPNQDGARVA